jgi:predicted double-glycine peptidase
MTKHKTSISIDREIWKEWTKFVIDKTGSSRKASMELENAMKEYMENHKYKANNGGS